MDQPTMFEPFEVTTDVHVLPAYFPVPHFGLVPVNAFVLKTDEPVLVDTGLVYHTDEFIDKLATIVDLRDLRWLWLSHCDPDHIGSLQRVLAEAPNLRVITSFIGTGRMSLSQPPPMDRIHWLNPGQSIHVGDRSLLAVRPPTYDSPETTGFYDASSEVFFSADSFGAVLNEPIMNAADIDFEALSEGLVRWTKLDSPWLHLVDGHAFQATLNGIRDLSPRLILSSHLPPARDMTEALLECLATVPAGEPFVSPDQQALEAMLGEMAGH